MVGGGWKAEKTNYTRRGEAIGVVRRDRRREGTEQSARRGKRSSGTDQKESDRGQGRRDSGVCVSVECREANVLRTLGVCAMSAALGLPDPCWLCACCLRSDLAASDLGAHSREQTQQR